MQIGRNRRRRGHGLRQPEVKRKLRAFVKRAEEQSGPAGHVERMRTDSRPMQAPRRDRSFRRCCRASAPRQAGRARRSPVTMRAMRAPSRAQGVIPIADQQEGKEARQLPEEDELDEISGQHDPEHRAHEGEQEREEAVGRESAATCSSARTPLPAGRCP